MSYTKKTYNINVKGLVQGVGFRPFIYRIASDNCIKGTVENNNQGVNIFAQGSDHNIKIFIEEIETKKPQAAFIDNINIIITESDAFSNFNIIKSNNDNQGITRVSPDIAVCDDCLEDIKKQNHRINYPLTNCTNCGPRFTIIRDIPYDRHNTTMEKFKMCDQCNSEYNDVLDRRFHAQPVACNSCGPIYQLHLDGQTYYEINTIIDKTSKLIDEGKNALIKGMGGFFITCDAQNTESINKVRKIKAREAKPFAVMVKDINSASKYVKINTEEERLLTSFRKPVVICDIKEDKRYLKNFELITNGINTLGILLPYMPFHYMLFEKLETDIIVFTSGNISDEPIVKDDEIALEIFKDKTDAIITYNREIYNRVDDSVLSVFKNRPNIIRRSRGFVPDSITLPFETEGILATGAELVNTFAIGKDKEAILSQHIGDLRNFETYDFYKESINRYERLFKFKPELVVCDKHPDYLSTRYAKELKTNTIEVQHHHAHMASCMAENNIDEKVIGIILDGTGLGDDGNIWGSEFFIGDILNYQREFHFEYIKLPGGDKAVKEPWRIAYSYLKKYFPEDNHYSLFDISENTINLLDQMLDKNINSPLSCGAGRLFDAVAAITGLCSISRYHSQAPVLLESKIDHSCSDEYNYEIKGKEVIFRQMFLELIKDINDNISINIISTKFHNTIISVIFEIVKRLNHKYNLNKVVLSGGTFQNKFLTTKVIDLLVKNDFEVFTQQKVPANDGGISLGQLAIAAKRRENNVS